MLIKIKVLPRSSHNEIIKLAENEYKVKLTAAPVGGKANDGLITVLSEEWGVPKSKIKIAKGLASRNKMVEINTNLPQCG